MLTTNEQFFKRYAEENFTNIEWKLFTRAIRNRVDNSMPFHGICSMAYIRIKLLKPDRFTIQDFTLHPAASGGVLEEILREVSRFRINSEYVVVPFVVVALEGKHLLVEKTLASRGLEEGVHFNKQKISRCWLKRLKRFSYRINTQGASRLQNHNTQTVEVSRNMLHWTDDIPKKERKTLICFRNDEVCFFIQ